MGFYRDSLQKLAQSYLYFLMWQEENEIQKFLSLDFLRRLNVTNQIRLIKRLPRFLYGFGLEACLQEKYALTQTGGEIFISPFQFDISKSLHVINFIESEKTTITLHSVVLEDRQWKFDAIVTPADVRVLQNLVNRISVKGK